MGPTLQVNGIDVFIEGEGPQTVVMVHGWPDTHRLWDAQVEELKAHHRCVRFTLPGFDVAKRPEAHTLEDVIDAIKAVVQRTSPGHRVALMLHDWGCFFGYQFAMRWPAKVSKIVGIDIGDVGSTEYLRSLSLRSKGMIAAYQLWLVLGWRIGGPIGNVMTRALARAIGAPGRPETIGACMNYPYDIRWTRSHGSYRQTLEFRPACPMLFAYGTRKPFLFHSPRWAAALDAIPGNRVIAFDTGHWVMTGAPQAFNAAVDAWLEGREA
jgi:pimeloyl-ACP methyl ester carboxylesterase